MTKVKGMRTTRSAEEAPEGSNWKILSSLGYRLKDGTFSEVRKDAMDTGVKNPMRYVRAQCLCCGVEQATILTSIRTKRSTQCRDCARMSRNKKPVTLETNSPEEAAAIAALEELCRVYEENEFSFPTVISAFKEAGFNRVPRSQPRFGPIIKRVTALTERGREEAADREQEEAALNIVPALLKPMSADDYWEYRTGRAC